MRLMRARLDESKQGFNCPNCQLLYAKAGARPACWEPSPQYPWGNACPVYDVAPDVELNRLADAFIKFELLDQSPGAARFQDKILRDSGLGDETPETFLELKGVISEYRARQQARAEQKTKGTRRR